MAITLLSAPAFIGMTQNPLVWKFNAPAGARVILQIQIETAPYSDTWISLPEYGMTANLTGQARFDLSRKLKPYLQHNAPGFFDVASSVASDVCRRYKLKWKEETGGSYGDYLDPQAILLGGLQQERYALPTSPPDAPTLLSATADITGILLALVDQTGGTAQHEIWVSQTSSTDGFSKLTTLAAGEVTHTHQSVASLTQYWYKARSVLNGASSGFGNVATATSLEVSAAFISEWDTTNTGSATDRIVLPLISSGTYDFQVWYDDALLKTITDYTDNEVIFSDGTGVKEISIIGTIDGWNFLQEDTDRQKITDISAWGSLSLGTDLAHVGGEFYECVNLDISATDELNLTGRTSLHSLFRGCTSLTKLPAADTSLITDMTLMAFGCSALVTIPLWDTSSLLIMSNTFKSCTSLVTMPAWDLTSVTTLYDAWGGCTSLTTVPAFSIPSCNSLYLTWNGCTSLTTFPLLTNTDNVTTAAYAWYNCTGLDGYDFPTIAFHNVASFLLAFDGWAMTTAAYDALLIDLEANNPKNLVRLDTDATYTGGGAAETARSALFSRGWTFNDGGVAP